MFSTKNYERFFCTLFSFIFLLCIPFLSSAQDDEYCIPYVEGEDIYITNFYFNDINNNSGNDNYMFFPSPVTTIVPGFTYNYSISFSTTAQKYYAAYFDLNGDGVFSEVNDKLITGVTTATSVTGLLTMPLTPDFDVNSRIRVIVSKDAITGYCNSISEGDVEDYPFKRNGKPDSDWDIVVSAGKYVPDHTGDGCGTIEFSIEAFHCGGNQNSTPISNMSYGVTIYEPGYNQSPGALPFYSKTLSTAWSSSNGMDVSIPVENPLPPYFQPGKIYSVDYEHGVIDHDCFNGQDMEMIEIDPYPDCTSEKELSRANEVTQINPLDALNEPESNNEFSIKPNPFNEQVIIQYDLKSIDKVTIQIFDIYGKQVMTLMNNLEQEPGYYQQELLLDKLSAGAYYLLIKGAHFYHSEKLIKM